MMFKEKLSFFNLLLFIPFRESAISNLTGFTFNSLHSPPLLIVGKGNLPPLPTNGGLAFGQMNDSDLLFL